MAQFLTDAQIEDIVSVIPEPKGLSKEVAKSTQEQLRSYLRNELYTIKLVPIAAAIQEFKNIILQRYGRARVISGTSVGSTAAEAVGGPIAQAAISSFHVAGSSTSKTGGISGFRELLDATENPKVVNMTLFFKNNVDINYIYDFRQRIVHRTLYDIMESNYEIISYNEAIKSPWVEDFRYCFPNVEIPSSSNEWVLRLKMNMEVMYTYGITMKMIASAIIDYNDEGSKRRQPVVPVYAPMAYGDDKSGLIMDIYIDKNAYNDLPGTTQYTMERKVYSILSILIIPTLGNITVSGIRGIDNVFPISTPVFSVVKETRIEKDLWLLQLNTVKARMLNINIERVASLIKDGFDIEKKYSNRLYVRSRTPSTTPNAIPSRYVMDKIKVEEESIKKQIEHGQAIQKPVNLILSKFYLSAHVIYAGTDNLLVKKKSKPKTIRDITGALREVLSMDEIDPYHSYCSDVNEMFGVWGIIAARNLHANELYSLTTSVSSIDPRHVLIVSDFMTNLGQVYSMTSLSVARQRFDVMTKAGFVKAGEQLIAGAVMGDKSEVTSITQKIMTGELTSVGTGYNKELRDEQLQLKYADDEKRLSRAQLILQEAKRKRDNNLSKTLESKDITVKVTKDDIGEAVKQLTITTTSSIKKMSLKEMFGKTPASQLPPTQAQPQVQIQPPQPPSQPSQPLVVPVPPNTFITAGQTIPNIPGKTIVKVAETLPSIKSDNIKATTIVVDSKEGIPIPVVPNVIQSAPELPGDLAKLMYPSIIPSDYRPRSPTYPPPPSPTVPPPAPLPLRGPVLASISELAKVLGL